jgi:4-hydroxy-tetrahydrodipicolinate synthase
MTALMTPFNAQGEMLLEPIPHLLEFHRQAGIVGVVSGGTNGEATSLSVEERKRLLEALVEQSGGLFVVAGTGATSIADARELTRHAARVGATAALVLPPFFVKNPTVEGLYGYFSALLDCADIPQILYHIPQFTAVPLPDEMIDRLQSHPNLMGMKDSSGDVEHTLGWLERYPNLSLFSGSDLIHAQVYPKGAMGCISGSANVFPDLISAIWRGYKEDPTGQKMQEAQDEVLRLAKIYRSYPPIAVNKAILAHKGFPFYHVRPPLVDFSAEMRQTLIRELQEAKFLS